MAVIEEKIDTLSGRNLYLVFLAGAHKIIEHQKELNKINVFPVPDADTGTNLASTIRSIVDSIQPNHSYKETAQTIADAALNGARGNSGVIFAQFLHGLNAETCNCEKVTIANFAKALKNGVNYIYEAVAEPVEGTMLTVIKDWADHIWDHHEKKTDFIQLIKDSYQAAEISLQETTSKLKVLAKSNVVDAGAKGFVLFLEGIIELITTNDIQKFLRKKDEMIELPFEEEEIDHESFTYRFCTEAVIKGEKLDKAAIRKTVSRYGDSLVVAGSERICRIHIHTDTPQELFYQLKDFGTMTYQKADDMLKQYQVAHERKWKIALVTDSSCDLAHELMEEYQIHMVPINIFIGDNHYLDKVTVHPKNFYDLVDESKDFPTTAQPNQKAFENLYSHLASHYDSVIAVHLTGKFSGTFENSKKAAEKISDEFNKSISVINSNHLSGSLGLIALRIAKAIEGGLQHEDILEKVEEWKRKSRILVSVKNLKYMVRGGRVSPMKEKIASLMNVKPIVSMDQEGNSTLFDKAYSQKGNMKKVMKHTLRHLEKEGKVWNYIVLHANNEKGATYFEDEMRKLTGKAPASVVNISPVVGLSAGRGAVSLAYMLD